MTLLPRVREAPEVARRSLDTRRGGACLPFTTASSPASRNVAGHGAEAGFTIAAVAAAGATPSAQVTRIAIGV